MVAWQEIEVLRGSEREPVLHLHGNAAALAQQIGLNTWSLSLSHTHLHAIALVVAVGVGSLIGAMSTRESLRLAQIADCP